MVQMSWNVKQKLKRSVVKTQLAKPVNYQTLEKKLNDNLLDLYYEKYCHPLPVTVMRNKSAPVKSPLLEDKRKVRFFKSYHRGQHCQNLCLLYKRKFFYTCNYNLYYFVEIL